MAKALSRPVRTPPFDCKSSRRRAFPFRVKKIEMIHCIFGNRSYSIFVGIRPAPGMQSRRDVVRRLPRRRNGARGTLPRAGFLLEGIQDMKKFSLILVAMLAVTALAASMAMAGDCKTEKAQKTTQAKAGCDRPCPTETAAKAASADAKASCDKTATAAAAADKPCPEDCPMKASCDKPCPTTGATHAGMGDCCITAAIAGEGCCGHDAETVKAAFAACPVVKTAMSEMHKCCAEAVAAGKGCCGKDAEALKADFDKKVAESRAKEMASM